MYLSNIIMNNQLTLKKIVPHSLGYPSCKYTFKGQLQKDEFSRVIFKGYDRDKLTSDVILQDVARRLLESVDRPLTQRKKCDDAYLPLKSDAKVLGEYKLDIVTGVRYFRIVKYPDYYELQKNVYTESDDALTKVNVLRLFSDRVMFHSVERETPGSQWGESIEHLETIKPENIESYKIFFDQLEKM